MTPCSHRTLPSTATPERPTTYTSIPCICSPCAPVVQPQCSYPNMPRVVTCRARPTSTAPPRTCRYDCRTIRMAGTNHLHAELRLLHGQVGGAFFQGGILRPSRCSSAAQPGFLGRTASCSRRLTCATAGCWRRGGSRRARARRARRSRPTCRRRRWCQSPSCRRRACRRTRPRSCGTCGRPAR